MIFKIYVSSVAVESTSRRAPGKTTIPTLLVELAAVQILSLDSSFSMEVPPANMRIGPLLDTLNFYANAMIAFQQKNLRIPGDIIFFSEEGKANSWTKKERNVLFGQVYYSYFLADI